MSESIVTNEDCMALMARYPDKHFDLAVVDPPYGMGDRWIRPGENAHKAASLNGSKWDNEVPTQGYFDELSRICKRRIIWGGNYFNLGPCRGYLVWDKPEMRIFTMADGELAWTDIDGPLKIKSISRASRGPTIHPTQKPIALYEWIYKKYAKPGWKILDTHLGSGSNRIAAYKAGLDFVGCELDKDYFDAQEKRWAAYASQGSLI